MKMRVAIIILTTLFSAAFWGQAPFTIPLEKLNTSLAVPAMAARNGIVYAAYRSFDWMHQSDKLQVLAYDLSSRTVITRSTIPVPKVRGARANDGLAVSPDGSMLAYVEAHEPNLILLISSKDLSELRQSSSIPFSTQDHQHQFAGFDDSGRLSFSSINGSKPRFIRIDTSDFKIASDVKASHITKTVFQYLAWSPRASRFWIPSGGGNVLQFTESGDATDHALKTDFHELDHGAIALGQSGVVAFFAMLSKGVVASYIDHKIGSLELPCSPSPYGASNDVAYVGAICTTQPNKLPEAGGDKVLTSDFFLIRTKNPQIVWKQTMNAIGAGNNDYFRWASTTIEHKDTKVWVVAPVKKPELSIYEIAVPE